MRPAPSSGASAVIVQKKGERRAVTPSRVIGIGAATAMNNQPWWRRRRVVGAAIILGLLVAAALPLSSLAAPATATDGPGALAHFDWRARTASARRRIRLLKSGSRSPMASSATSTTRPMTTPTSSRCNTSSPTAQLHRPTDPRHDVYRPAAQLARAGLPCHNDGQERQVSHHHRLPHRYTRNTVVMSTRFVPLVGNLSNYRLYVRYDSSLNGNGGGGSGNGGGEPA